MVHCFVAQAMWREAVDESFSILQSLPAGLEGRYLPDLGKTGGGDQDFCGLVVEIVLSVVKCVSMSQSKDGREYRRVLDFVEELTPWFRSVFWIGHFVFLNCVLICLVAEKLSEECMNQYLVW